MWAIVLIVSVCVQDNAHDGVTVRVALSADDQYRSLRATMLADLGLARYSLVVCLFVCALCFGDVFLALYR